MSSETRTSHLRSHIQSLLSFYTPLIIDPTGGYHNQLLDDGTVYDHGTKHVVGTARFVVCYAYAARVFPEREREFIEVCEHGVKFLMGEHWDEEHGGFTWVLQKQGDGAGDGAGGGTAFVVEDGNKWGCVALATDNYRLALLCLHARTIALNPTSSKRTEALLFTLQPFLFTRVWPLLFAHSILSLHFARRYSVAFSLLALSSASLSGVQNLEPSLSRVHDLLKTFQDGDTGAFIDSFDRPLKTPSTYRGQNSNMHMCEGLIASYEATGNREHLAAAARVAKLLTLTLAGGCGWVIEHYDEQWVADPDKNRDVDAASEEYVFRPPGYQPGHSMEWAKLLVLLDRHTASTGTGNATGEGELQCISSKLAAQNHRLKTTGKDHLETTGLEQQVQNVRS